MNERIAVETSNRRNSINDSQHRLGGTVNPGKLNIANQPGTINGNGNGQYHSLSSGTRSSEAVKFNVPGNPAAAKNIGRRNTRDPPLGLTDLLGDDSVAIPDLSDAKRLSIC